MAAAGVVALELVVDFRGSVESLLEEVCADKRRRTVHLVEVLDLFGNVDISVGVVKLLRDKLVAEYGSEILSGHGLEGSGIEQRSRLVFHIGAHVVPLCGNLVFVQINFIRDFCFRHRNSPFKN